MGMSASQARLLSITSRMNDVEFKSQQISNTKIRLADESEQVANDYTKALNKQKYTFTGFQNGQTVKMDLNSTNMANSGLSLVNRNNPTQQYRVKNGNQVVGTYKTEAEANTAAGSNYTVEAFYPDVPDTYSASDLYEMIESGQYYLLGAVSTTTADGVTTTTKGEISVSSNTQLAIESDTTELAKAEAEYNAKTAKINNKEKLLDNDLKALDTEHTALKTEYDSVKSLISENIDKSFNLFS